MSNTKRITVILADDHPLLRSGFLDVVRETKDIEVVYDTDNPQDACKAFKKFKPHVVVMDIMFKDKMTGLDAIKEILNINSQAAIVVLSQFDQPQLIKEAYQLGALSFIPKNAEPTMLIEAIKLAALGTKYVVPEVAQKLAFLSLENDENPIDVLTKREFEVYKLIALDKSNIEIAEELGVSQKTVNNALQVLRDKLGLRRNTEITKLALKYRHISLEE